MKRYYLMIVQYGERVRFAELRPVNQQLWDERLLEGNLVVGTIEEFDDGRGDREGVKPHL